MTPRLLPLAALLLAGCRPSLPPAAPPPAPAPPAELGAAFDAAQTGTVAGRITWAGPAPEVPPQVGAIPAGDGYAWAKPAPPFAPRIDAKSRGLAGVLVTLDGVDLAKSRPWDHPPVALEFRNFQLQALDGTLGPWVARRGVSLSIVSHDAELHSLRARGAAFFSLSLPRPEAPRERPLPEAGLVELTSGAGYHWVAADVWVGEHPYAAVTDAEGRFTLPRVPAGAYTLTTRARNWQTVGRERDPETGLVFRNVFAPPRVRTAAVRVGAGASVGHVEAARAEDFPPR